nr:hypothetical protein [Neomegalonema perideroedes]
MGDYGFIISFLNPLIAVDLQSSGPILDFNGADLLLRDDDQVDLEAFLVGMARIARDSLGGGNARRF